MSSDVKEKNSDNKEYYKCIKVPLQHIIKHEDTLNKINNAVIKANKIVIHALQFMKLYLLDYYDKNNSLPLIDKLFVNSILKIVCNEASNGRPPLDKVKKQKTELKKVFDEHYKNFMIDIELDYQHLNTVLDYLTVDIITMYENNIKQHYVEYIERYVNVFLNKKEEIEKIKNKKLSDENTKNEINELCQELRKIKDDIFSIKNNIYKSNNKYHKWINENKNKLIPTKIFKKDNLYYDLQCSPQDYYPNMIFMMKEIEKQDKTIYNVFPLRNEITPKHIRIDTTTLIHLLFNGNQEKPKSFFLTKGNLVKYEDKLWAYFFRTDKKCFSKPDYTFHHMIETDGISASILLLRDDMLGKRIPIKKNIITEKYIDELEDYSKLKKKKIVSIDPNMSDILYCVDATDKNRTQFRYTQNQRRKETKIKKYRNIILDKKKDKIDNKTIIELETELSNFNRKTLNFDKFKIYIQKKNEINNKLYNFYEVKLFRKLKLNGYINKKRNEQKMINNFKDTYGSPEDIIICIGDWEQKKRMKYGKEPTKGKGIRKIFKQSKYQIYLVDEFRTSCRCSKCGNECSTFRECKNPKPWKKEETITRHGVVKCQTCHTLWNRDENSSANIYKVSYNAIRKKKRPKYLRRDKQSISGATSALQTQNLHEDAKPQPCKSLKRG